MPYCWVVERPLHVRRVRLFELDKALSTDVLSLDEGMLFDGATQFYLFKLICFMSRVLPSYPSALNISNETYP